MTLLDNMASSQPQLSGTEVGLLLGAIAASGVGPIFFPGTSITEVLAPAAAAFTAAIKIGSEIMAVADGKEIAANTIMHGRGGGILGQCRAREGYHAVVCGGWHDLC